MAEPTAFRTGKVYKYEQETNIYHFSHKTTKEAYEKMQFNYLKRKRADLVRGTLVLWSLERIDMYIEILLDYKKSGANKPAIPEEVAAYDIFKPSRFSTYKLVLKNKKNCGRVIFVIPWEESFDVISEIHRRLGHRGPSSCKNLCRNVRRKYVIDKIWIKLFLRACNTCAAKAKINFWNDYAPSSSEIATPYFKCYQIFSLAMQMPDTPFNYILIVVDKKTNFIHLRPVGTGELTEITSEMLKIFTDFGFPKAMATREMDFYERVSTALSNLTKQPKIPVLKLTATDIPPWIEMVKAHLVDWMCENKSDNWAIGCQFVQWQMNNTKTDNKSPFKEVFHREPIIELIAIKPQINI